jgi:hypothetical protein
VGIRTVSPSPRGEKWEAPTILSAAAANRVRDALARQVAARPGFVAEALYLLGLSDAEVFRLCNLLLALDARDSERAA